MHGVRTLPDLSIRQLEYLVAVVDEPTWALAARRVGVSASALSQGLAEFERRVGVSLFERDGRRRVVRASAEPVVAHARQVLALTADLADWSDRIVHGRAGRLRVGMIDAAAVIHFPEELRAFRATNPDVELLLRVVPSAELIAQLIAGTLDLVVCVEPPTPADGVDIEVLLTEPLALYGPPGAPIGQPSSWGPWVLFPTGSHTRSVIVSLLAGLGAPLEVVAESHQPDVVREMVRLGSGWTVLPVSQAEHGDRPLAPGRVVASRHLVLAVRRGTIRDPAVDALAEVLRNTVGHRDGRHGA